MNAQQSYREGGVLGASPVALVVRLYEKMVEDLHHVSSAIDKKDLRLRTDRIKHAILIVGHLESSLDFDQGGRVARDLELFYKTLRFRLVHLQFHPSRENVAQIITDLLTVRAAWVQVEAQVEAPAEVEVRRGGGVPAEPARSAAGGAAYSPDSGFPDPAALAPSHTSWRG